MNKINFPILLSYLFIKHIIHCQPDYIDKSIKIDFDLNNINNNDYIIKINCYKPAGYQFIPRPDRTITNVKIEGHTVWLKSKSLFVSDIIVYFVNYKRLRYSINFIDNKGNRDSIHYYHQGGLQVIGIIDYYNNIDDKWLFYNESTIFDLNSPFDYRNQVTKIFESPNKVHRNVVVDTRGMGKINEIYDGNKLIYKSKTNKKIIKFVFSWKDGEKLLIKCQTDYFGNELIYFKYIKDINKWEIIKEVDYNRIYYDNGMNLANIQLLEMEKIPLLVLNLLDIIYFDPLETHGTLLGIPSIQMTFKILMKLKDGNQVIFSKALRNAKVYLFRGEDSFEMIEIIHHIFVNSNTGEETIKFTDSSSVIIRGLNYYFIKENNKWNEVSQSRFFNKFKNLAISNLERTIYKLSQFESEHSKLKLDKNNDLLVSLKQLEYVDNAERIETDEAEFTDDVVENTLDEPNEDKIPNSSNSNAPRIAYKPTNGFIQDINTGVKNKLPITDTSKYRFSEPKPINEDNPPHKPNQEPKKPRKIFRTNSDFQDVRGTTESQNTNDQKRLKDYIIIKTNINSNEKENSFYKISIIPIIIFFNIIII